ncbi:MAG: ABC transporter permease [Lachnospiraceae bacterium]|jgi:lipopolysaccharide transport system permease protein
MIKDIKEIYAYREMIATLVRKDLRGRYKGSVLGFLWTFINPLFQLLIYTMVFSVIMKSGEDQYYLFLFVCLIPWMFFATSLQDGSISIIREQDMVKKIYFPRAVLPIATVTSAFVNMLLTFIVVIAVTLISGRGINPKALACLPIVMIVEYVLCLGVAFIASALTVYLRDLQYIFGIFVMGLQYASPVMYRVDNGLVPDSLMWIFKLNPMTSILNSYRDCLYDKVIPDFGELGYGFIFGVVLTIVGFILFEHLQKGFAENF